MTQPSKWSKGPPTNTLLPPAPPAAEAPPALPSSARPAPTKKPRTTPAIFDAYVVLDFEATCENQVQLPVQEIIEFPFVIVDAQSGDIVGEFQRYVKPVHVPKLSAFCTQLTGITQETVDAAEDISTVLEQVLSFLNAAKLHDSPQEKDSRSFCFVTCGDWDLKSMFPRQLQCLPRTLSKPIPSYFKRWINIKSIFTKYITAHRRVGGMEDMLKVAGLNLEGRHHSGIDDCRNIARILQLMIKRSQQNNLEPIQPTSGTWAQPWKCVEPVTSWAHVTSSLSTHAPPPSHFDKSCLKENKNTAALPVPQTAAPTAGAPNAKAAPQGDASHQAAIALLLTAPRRDRQPNTQELIGFSKKLSLVLRHRAEELGLPIGPGGMVPLAKLMQLSYFRYMDLPTLASLVQDSDKQRFRLQLHSDAIGKTIDPSHVAQYIDIAANQGHSIASVEADVKPITSIDQCPTAVHGTYFKAWELIQASGGLSKMSRQHVHFAKGLPGDTGVISGMRGNVQVLVYLDVAKCLQDGIPLFESHNGVILSPGKGDTGIVPLAYLRAVTRQGEAL